MAKRSQGEDAKVKINKATDQEHPKETQSSTNEEYDLDSKFKVTFRTVAPNTSAWLKVTSQRTGFHVYVPLPIRLIQQIPDARGGGCIVRGAHGDEATTKENIVEILEALNGYPIGGAASCWVVAE